MGDDARRPGEFFVAMRDAAERAAAAAGWHDRHLAIAGQGVRLRFAGPALMEPILPALSHHERPPENDPVLTVLLWDSASTGAEIPPIPWAREEVGPLGQVPRYSDTRCRTAISPVFGGLTLFDSITRTAIFWARDRERITWSERANPLRTILHWGLGSPHRQLVHAGAVSLGGQGLVVGGPSGSGKSTTSILCLLAGFGYAGDDYVVVTLDAGRPTVHALYGTAKLSFDAATRVPALAGATINRDALGDTAAARPLYPDEKLVVDVTEKRPERLARETPVAAIVLPRIVARPCALQPAAPGEALRALAPSSVMQMPHSGGRADMGVLGALVRAAPAYRLDLGSDPDAVPELLGDLLRERVTA